MNGPIFLVWYMNVPSFLTPMYMQRCSQNAEKVTHFKGKLDLATIHFNCVPFRMGTSLKGKNWLPGGGGGANSFLYKQFLIV